MADPDPSAPHSEPDGLTEDAGPGEPETAFAAGPSAPVSDDGCPALLQTGQVLGGQFRILGKIGAGGMGQVFRARNEVLLKDVAIKVMHEASLEDSESRERFLAEGENTMDLAHRNIARTYHVGVEGPLYFMVMELLLGESLQERIEAYSSRERRFEWKETREITRQIGAGLQYAHDHNVVHRDIKPANIFVVRAHPNASADATRFRDEVKILDFGIAKSEKCRQTQVGDVFGTPYYMAPEQHRDTRDVDGRADQYSLAKLLVRMLATSRDLPAETPDELREIPFLARRALNRALSPDPRKRFQSIDEFINQFCFDSKPVRSKGILVATILAVVGAGGWYAKDSLLGRSGPEADPQQVAEGGGGEPGEDGQGEGVDREADGNDGDSEAAKAGVGTEGGESQEKPEDGDSQDPGAEGGVGDDESTGGQDSGEQDDDETGEGKPEEGEDTRGEAGESEKPEDDPAKVDGAPGENTTEATVPEGTPPTDPKGDEATDPKSEQEQDPKTDTDGSQGSKDDPEQPESGTVPSTGLETPPSGQGEEGEDGSKTDTEAGGNGSGGDTGTAGGSGEEGTVDDPKDDGKEPEQTGDPQGDGNERGDGNAQDGGSRQDGEGEQGDGKTEDGTSQDGTSQDGESGTDGSGTDSAASETTPPPPPVLRPEDHVAEFDETVRRGDAASLQALLSRVAQEEEALLAQGAEALPRSMVKELVLGGDPSALAIATRRVPFDPGVAEVLLEAGALPLEGSADAPPFLHALAGRDTDLPRNESLDSLFATLAGAQPSAFRQRWPAGAEGREPLERAVDAGHLALAAALVRTGQTPLGGRTPSLLTRSLEVDDGARRLRPLLEAHVAARANRPALPTLSLDDLLPEDAEGDERIVGEHSADAVKAFLETEGLPLELTRSGGSTFLHDLARTRDPRALAVAKVLLADPRTESWLDAKDDKDANPLIALLQFQQSLLADEDLDLDPRSVRGLADLLVDKGTSIEDAPEEAVNAVYLAFSFPPEKSLGFPKSALRWLERLNDPEKVRQLVNEQSPKGRTAADRSRVHGDAAGEIRRLMKPR